MLSAKTNIIFLRLGNVMKSSSGIQQMQFIKMLPLDCLRLAAAGPGLIVLFRCQVKIITGPGAG